MRSAANFSLLLTVLLAVAGLGTHAQAQDPKPAGWVKEISSSDPDLCARAKLQLLRPENLAQISSYRAEILSSITNINSEEDAIILGAIDLPPDRKQALLASRYTPDKVRARLGDELAKERVIKRLSSEATMVTTRKAAQDVLYVNDAESMEAFAKGLESKRVFEDPHGNRVSAALVLIEAYGEAHPEAKLFSSGTYIEHANVSESEFQSAVHQNYLRELEKYLKDLYGVEVHLDPPLLLDTNKIGVYKQAVPK